VYETAKGLWLPWTKLRGMAIDRAPSTVERKQVLWVELGEMDK
jgi:hypothetical protein